MTENRLHVDFETRSTCDLKVTGADKYAKDPDTDIWVMVYSFDGLNCGTWFPGMPLPPAVVDHVASGGLFVAHNVHFELAIWNNILAPRYGAPPLKIEQCDCTMIRALASALPAGLDQLGQTLNLSVQKDMEGKRLMQRMARPRRIDDDGSVVWWNEPDKVERLTTYCIDDVKVEFLADEKLPALIPSERQLMNLDYQINQRGVALDVKTIRRAKLIAYRHRKLLSERLQAVTRFSVSSAQAVTQLRLWVEERGVHTPDLRATTVAEILTRKDIPDDVREALQIREEVGRNSLAKLDAMLNSVDDDGRARGLFAFTVATTGRWSGRRVQPQNLPRPSLTETQIEHVIEIVNRSKNPVEALQEEFGSVTEPISSSLRAMFMAEPGNILTAADFSAIEGRVLAWLAGQEDILEVFRTGKDIYKYTAGAIYQKAYEDVTKDERFVGKVGTLALGYQGGGGAFLKMAEAYGVKDMTFEFAEEIKDKWRGANRKIVRFWHALEEGAINAIQNPGKVYGAGDKDCIRFKKVGAHLIMKLPSGRYLTYPYAAIAIDKSFGKSREVVSFYGQDTYTRQWGRQTTYGGKLSENATQAVARDVQAGALLRTNSLGYPTVLHVHDEIVAETAKGFGSVEEFHMSMAEVPAWAGGLPIAAEGWQAERYQK